MLSRNQITLTTDVVELSSLCLFPVIFIGAQSGKTTTELLSVTMAHL